MLTCVVCISCSLCARYDTACLSLFMDRGHLRLCKQCVFACGGQQGTRQCVMHAELNIKCLSLASVHTTGIALAVFVLRLLHAAFCSCYCLCDLHCCSSCRGCIAYMTAKFKIVAWPLVFGTCSAGSAEVALFVDRLDLCTYQDVPVCLPLLMRPLALPWLPLPMCTKVRTAECCTLGIFLMEDWQSLGRLSMCTIMSELRTILAVQMRR